MDNTISAMAAGLKYHTQAMNITANNLANAESIGFKRSEVQASEFGSYLSNRIDGSAAQIGSGNRGVTASKVYNDDSQGAIYATESKLDFALNGEGSFTLSGAGGGQIMTRDGRFQTDANGYLTDADGNFVMGQNGRIYVGAGDIAVSEDGGVWAGGYYKDTLMINSNGGLPCKVMQGYLERSNVNLTDEMAAMIEDSRAFQSCSQIVRSADKILEKTVTEIGKV